MPGYPTTRERTFIVKFADGKAYKVRADDRLEAKRKAIIRRGGHTLPKQLEIGRTVTSIEEKY